MTELDVKRDLESLSSQLDNLCLLFDAVAFGIFNLQGNFRAEFLFFLCSESDLNLLLLARLDCSVNLADNEFFRKTLDAT